MNLFNALHQVVILHKTAFCFTLALLGFLYWLPDFMTQQKTVKTIAASTNTFTHMERAKKCAFGLISLMLSIAIIKARIHFNW